MLESDRLTEGERKQYAQLINIDTSNKTGFSMSDDMLQDSLSTLCHLLYRHYGQKVILLIDEYDVPLDKAKQGEYYGKCEKYGQIREWYDGYRFGNADIYCPWDVINYVKLILSEPDAFPRAFWINTSSNSIIRRFLQKANISTRRDIEKLIEGESVVKKINQELTYRDLYKNIGNLWSMLFTTGYLTYKEKIDEDTYGLSIPNQEIRKIFIEQILKWFQEEARKDTPKLDAFCDAFTMGKSQGY